MLFIGELRRRPRGEESDAPLVKADAVDRLVAERARSPLQTHDSGDAERRKRSNRTIASTSMSTSWPLSSALTEPLPDAELEQAPPKKTRTRNLNYYACTRPGCGWSGSRYADHRSRKPDCLAYPCTVMYTKGTCASAAVARLASCRH